MFMKSRWNKCLYFFYLGWYLSVWHYYLDSMLAFKIEIQISYNLWTKPLSQLRLIYEQFIYVLYLDLVVYITFVLNKFWLIDWLIDWVFKSSGSSRILVPLGSWVLWVPGSSRVLGPLGSSRVLRPCFPVCRSFIVTFLFSFVWIRTRYS